jgi:hypothetical protein
MELCAVSWETMRYLEEAGAANPAGGLHRLTEPEKTCKPM